MAMPSVIPARRNLRARALAFLIIFGLSATAYAQGSACGGMRQPPCTREFYSCLAGLSEVCYWEALERCDSATPRVDGDHLCNTLRRENGIHVPTAVNFMDGDRHVTEGYVTEVDLDTAHSVVPNGSHPAICTTAGDTDLASVVPNAIISDIAAWVEEPDYAPVLAVNGSFFALDRSGSAWEMACTHVFGYTVSDGTLVRAEERITAYNVGAPPEAFDPGTLLFYGPGRSKPAEFKWYPFLAGAPSSVPTGVVDAISGIPLVKNGAFVQHTGPEADTPHPRTAVGLTEGNDKLIVVVVNPGSDSGTRLEALANYLISMGVKNAVNFDGGGSSQFYYLKEDNRMTASLPSDVRDGRAHYRPVANMLGFW